jgi:ceramide glucosyltransferase
LIFTFGFAWAMIAVLLAHGATWAWMLLSTALALRVVQAIMTGWLCLEDRQVFRFLWLLPLRDLLAVAVWLASFFGHTIRWRGDLFYLKDGKLVRPS